MFLCFLEWILNILSEQKKCFKTGIGNCIKKEKNKNFAFIGKKVRGVLVTYLMFNKEYFMGVFKMWVEGGVFNFVLDSLSYLKRNCVVNSMRDDLRSIIKMRYKVAVKKGMVITLKNGN